MRGVLAVTTALLALTPGASAIAYDFDGQQLVDNDDQAARLLADAALPFAAARVGLGACPAGVELYTAPTLGITRDGSTAVAAAIDCRIWLRADWLAGLREQQRAQLRWAMFPPARANLVTECVVIVHEAYHALGWQPAEHERHPTDPDHAAAGFMRPTASYLDAPGDCWAWAGRIVRARRAELRARHAAVERGRDRKPKRVRCRAARRAGCALRR